MAETNRSEEKAGGEFSPAPIRRSGRNRRNKTTLSDSLKHYVEHSSPSEVEKFSNELENSLGTLEADQLPQSNEKSNEDAASNPNGPMQRRPSGKEYAPVSTSRRASRAGSAIAESMKLNAAAVLAQLGEISDDDLDDDLMGVVSTDSPPIKEFTEVSVKD